MRVCRMCMCVYVCNCSETECHFLDVIPKQKNRLFFPLCSPSPLNLQLSAAHFRKKSKTGAEFDWQPGGTSSRYKVCFSSTSVFVEKMSWNFQSGISMHQLNFHIDYICGWVLYYPVFFMFNIKVNTLLQSNISKLWYKSKMFFIAMTILTFIRFSEMVPVLYTRNFQISRWRTFVWSYNTLFCGWYISTNWQSKQLKQHEKSLKGLFLSVCSCRG